MKRQRILVTGGAGFIGSHLVDKLISSGHDVFVIDDLSGGFNQNLNKHAQFFICDLRSVQETATIIEQIKPSLIYHLAANAAENKSQFSPIDITSRNYSVFINTLIPGIRAGMKRIVVTSSIAVYGEGQPPFKETDTPVPVDLYGLSKLSMERTLQILSNVHHFEYVITRPHNVYGPRQNMSDPYRNVVSLFFNAVLNEKPFYIYGNGQQRRCFSYIDDVVESIKLCGFEDVSGKIFNVGSDNSYTINELSQEVMKVTQSQIKPIYLAERPHEVQVAVSEHVQAIRFLKYKDTVTFSEGIRRSWEYAQMLGPQKLRYTPIELDSPLLPQNWMVSS